MTAPEDALTGGALDAWRIYNTQPGRMDDAVEAAARALAEHYDDGCFDRLAAEPDADSSDAEDAAYYRAAARSAVVAALGATGQASGAAL